MVQRPRRPRRPSRADWLTLAPTACDRAQARAAIEFKTKQLAERGERGVREGFVWPDWEEIEAFRIGLRRRWEAGEIVLPPFGVGGVELDGSDCTVDRILTLAANLIARELSGADAKRWLRRCARRRSYEVRAALALVNDL